MASGDTCTPLNHSLNCNPEQYLVNMLFMLKESLKELKIHPQRDVRIEADNPAATGVGPFPRLISDEQWIWASAAKMRQQGVTPFMGDVLRKLRDTLLGAGLAPED